MTRRNRAVDLTVITGLSGAGRSEAANALEDLGWFVVDNLPPALIQKMLALAFAQGADVDRVALVIDSRGGTFFDEAVNELARLRRDLSNFRLVFLEASDEVLVRRFESTRRRHPLGLGERVIVGIQRERELMGALRDGADLIVDTSEMSVRALRRRLAAFFEAAPVEGLKTTIISFGYKYGLPLDADIVLDCRFLPNPHWVDGLREQTGLDAPVRDYVMEHEAASDFLDRAADLFAFLLPGFEREGRHYLTVAVGCTGGRHRSVVLAEEIRAFLSGKGFSTNVIHRDVERPPVTP